MTSQAGSELARLLKISESCRSQKAASLNTQHENKAYIEKTVQQTSSAHLKPGDIGSQGVNGPPVESSIMNVIQGGMPGCGQQMQLKNIAL